MLLRIDELSRGDHAYLTEEDRCFYIREYTSHEGYTASETNQLVFNLKCPVPPPSKRVYWKNQAIRIAAHDISDALAGLPTDEIAFIPLPPSKLPGTAGYDPRVRDMLREAESKVGIRVVDALTIKRDRPAAHESPDRASITEHEANLAVQSLDWVDAKTVAIFDDVLTSGTQFKAAMNVLRRHSPNSNFVGVFWVRRIFPE